MDSGKTNRGHPSNREHDKQACPMQGLRQHAMKQLIFCESAIQPPQSSTKEIYILCAASRSKTLHFFSRENNTVCHGNEWNVGPGRIDAEAVFLWKHNSKGEAFTKAAYDSLPPPWWNKSKKESLLSLICAVGDPTLCFRESLENSATYCMVQLMLAFLLSYILLPQISQSLSLLLF